MDGTSEVLLSCISQNFLNPKSLARLSMAAFENMGISHYFSSGIWHLFDWNSNFWTRLVCMARHKKVTCKPQDVHLFEDQWSLSTATTARGELISTFFAVVWMLEKGEILMDNLRDTYQRVEQLLTRVPGCSYNGPNFREGVWSPVQIRERWSIRLKRCRVAGRASDSLQYTYTTGNYST